jgi:hypothetical protein
MLLKKTVGDISWTDKEVYPSFFKLSGSLILGEQAKGLKHIG